jgi:hypothetical protein
VAGWAPEGNSGSGGLEQVLDAYVAAWNAIEPSARQRLLDEAVTGDFVFEGPTGRFGGREAVDKLIAAMQERMPSTSVVRIGPGEAVDGWVEFGWEIRSDAGARLLGGTDVGELGPDGRLTRVEMKHMEA